MTMPGASASAATFMWHVVDLHRTLSTLNSLIGESKGKRGRGTRTPATADDSVYQTPPQAFLQGLPQLGWTIGHMSGSDRRHVSANVVGPSRGPAQLVALAREVILASSSVALGALQQ
jgi:hypothetical protein